MCVVVWASFYQSGDWADAYCSSNWWFVQPGGSIFFTTISRTWCSYAAAIVAAEDLLRIVPRGVHDWNKFVLPEELKRLVAQSMWCVAFCESFDSNTVCIENMQCSDIYFVKCRASDTRSRTFYQTCTCVGQSLYKFFFFLYRILSPQDSQENVLCTVIKNSVSPEMRCLWKLKISPVRPNKISNCHLCT